MVKQYISAVLEDLIGEYVVNISKDKIKLAALKGKIKLEDVELDGDFIGSHILGAVGLQGFGVLSCSAKTLQINIPWANLDEPTVMEIHGMHLLCVPLLPTTATRIYCGGLGSLHSSRVRCSLRTRAKRSALARFERNFFAGRISGEGPNLESLGINSDTLDYHGRGQRWSVIDDLDRNAEEENGIVFDSQDNNLVRSSASSMEGANVETFNKSNRSSPTKSTKEGRLPALKKKLTNKIYENLVSTVKGIHIRVEVPEGGLNFNSKNESNCPQYVESQVSSSELENSDRKAFAFGLTLKSLTVRNIPDRCTKSAPLIFPGKGGDNTDERTSKQVEIKDLSVYWDVDAPFLISECDLIKGLFSVDSSRSLSRIAIAMQELASYRNVSDDTISSLSNTDNAESKSSLLEKQKRPADEEHDYVCTDFSQIMITTFIDRVRENSLYSMEILPSLLDLSISSQQNRQYQRLRDSVLSQQRYDTMLQKRPSSPPIDDPIGWWKYSISCVKHKPTSRSWKDVVEIIRCREKYIDLVVKNLSSDGGNSGYHGGLSFQESNALLEIEDFLPIETLLTFHLLALRRVFASRHVTTPSNSKTRSASSKPRQGSLSSLSRLWKSLTRSTNSWRSIEEELPFQPLGHDINNPNVLISEKKHRDSSYSMIETSFQLNQFQLRVCLLERLDKNPIVAIEIDFKGLAHNKDSVFKVNLDILRCEVFDFATPGMTTGGKVLVIETTKDELKFQQVGRSGFLSKNFVFNNESVEYVTSSVDGHPEGVVCRLTAIASETAVSLSLSCHPVAIVWNKSCADAVADFFLSSTIEIQSQFLSRLQRAATPLAHRAQLAILYPSSLSASVNFLTLKVWFPVSMYVTDGALLLEMGKLDASSSKPEQSLEWNWNARATDIQINFARGLNTDAFDRNTDDTPQIDAMSNCLVDEMTILDQFQIQASGKSGESNSCPSHQNVHFPVNAQAPIGRVSGEISVDVGSIRLNLVDADELARAIGRFYASELIRMKSAGRNDIVDLQSNPDKSYDCAPSFEFNLLIEQVELALECNITDREKACHENRTYLIRVNCIKFTKRSKGLKAFSRLSIADAAVQLAEVQNDPNFLPRLFKPSKEAQHQILAKKISEISPHSDDDSGDTLVPPQTPKLASETPTLMIPSDLRANSIPEDSESIYTPERPSKFTEIVRACHFHDEENHTDEVEFDVLPLIIRITPLSILDFTNTSRRLLELIQLASTEIERKVHDSGRKARKKKQKRSPFPSSEPNPFYSQPSFNVTRDSEGNTLSIDSSFIFRVTFQAASILVGRPASEFCCSRDRRGLSTKPVDYVVQLSTNVSIIFQSIENANASGSKTLHISMDNFSAAINSNFEHSSGLPIIDPFGADFRSVYLTEATSEGSILVSQDFSLDCESITCRVTPHDVRVVSSIFRKTIDKLQPTVKVTPSAMNFQEKGSGIATRIRAELHSFSFVVLHLFQSHKADKVLNVMSMLRPFVELTTQNTKLRLEGCLAALTGELSLNASMNFFNPKLSSWEALVEPFQATATIDQMPNESLYTVSIHNHINVNFTGTLLSEIARIEHSSRTRETKVHRVIDDSVRSILLKDVKFVNSTGITLSLGVCASSSSFDSKMENVDTLDRVMINPGSSIPLKPLLNEVGDAESYTFSLSAPQRQTINITLDLSTFHVEEDAKCLVFMWNSCNKPADYHIQSVQYEPIIEYIMENQRLRPSVVDFYSIERGQDLISGTTWSPSAELKSKSLWLPPYLEGDAHEWTDLTCRHRCAKESFVLPNHNWMWANDWEIEIIDDLRQNDADGWEYSSDFETFSRERRSYRRGDLCRRRRWTRTRIRKTAFDEALVSPRPVVWETERCDSGMVILTRSHLTFHNKTSTQLSFFGYSSSLNEDKLIDSVPPESSIYVPIELAQITHIRLGTRKGSEMSMESSKDSMEDYFVTDRLMILPTGISTARVIRTWIDCDLIDLYGLSSLKRLHFFLRIKSQNGLCDVYIEPILRVLNLLPCQLVCQLGESQNASNGRKIVPTDEVEIPVGKEAKCTSVDCTQKPHISVRLPGTRWASWTRIVNRDQNSFTWRPTDEEELSLFESSPDAPNRGNEYKTILHLNNKCAGGNSVNVIISVETGHIPIIRVYAQYWILDKSGLGLKFTDGFIDLIGNTPDASTTRKSFSNGSEINSNDLKLDICRHGYEWSVGMNGMTLFFSKKERISLSIEYETGTKRTNSTWSTLLDVSRVMPTKSVVSVNEVDGPKRFELAYNVTLCSSIFSRTRVITFYPRYQIVNLLNVGLAVAQECALRLDTHIPSQSWVPFHWENSSFPTKIRLKFDEQENADENKWSSGCIYLDKIGITALRMPSTNRSKPLIIQAETRLATKRQDCAIMVVIWSSIEKSNPLYLMKNNSPFTVLCFQPTNNTQQDASLESRETPELFDKFFNFDCGHGMKFVDDDSDSKEFIWKVSPGESIGFGWDDPEVAHVLRWTCSNAGNFFLHGENHSVSDIEVDTIGHISTVKLQQGDYSGRSSGMEQQVNCEIKADKSTKVILFDLKQTNLNESGVSDNLSSGDTDVVAVSIQVHIPGLTTSVIDNVSDLRPGREIVLVSSDGWSIFFSQTREAYHEFEFKLSSFQIDNFIHAAEHPVLLHSPLVTEPFLHLSLVRRLQDNNDTHDISYIALRILEIDICFDRKTAEMIARFISPLHKAQEDQTNESWVRELTSKMTLNYSKSNRRAPRDIEKFIHSANACRIHVEHLHLHPIRLSLTFTQEWSRRNQETEGFVFFQIIRGMASISEAPLTFTSFVVSHAFESPTSLMGIISAHYSSQLMSQLLSIIGSLAILKAPADFLTNIGSGVFSFFYEPINGLVKGPEEFLQGLEHGTQNLARGIFVGFVKGAANVTDLVTHNLAGLTDDFFVDERNAYHKMMLYGGGNSATNKSIQDSLSIAGACVARGFKSGASGIIEQPSMYASRYGAIGLVKGVGKALVGAVVKPVVGVGDGAVVLMNHVSEATSDKEVVLKIPKRLRRALPAVSSGSSVKITPYDEISAKAQKIVTGGETVDDAYLGHVQTTTTLFIASSQCLWAIDNKTREPWCINWAEISNFGFVDGSYMRIDVFSNEGIHSNIYEMSSIQLANLFSLLSMQVEKMGNCSQLGVGFDTSDGSGSSGGMTSKHIPGVKSIQQRHNFGSINKPLKMTTIGITNEKELIKRCRTRVKELDSSMNDYFCRLDEESWLLVNSWGQYFTGLSSRRCVIIGIINGTLEPIQIKSAKLVEGGSLCYFIPSSEFDDIDNILYPGGAILFFGSGAVPSLLQSGRVAISIESNVFLFDLTDQISQYATAYTRPGLRASFLEKSFDKSGWWAKYWILISNMTTINC